MVSYRKPRIRAERQRKAAMVKAMRDSGIRTVDIAKYIGVSNDTVNKYYLLDLNPKWEEFENAIRKVYLEQDFELSQLTFKGLKKNIKTAKMKDLVELFKTIRQTNSTDRSPKNLSQTNIQFTITDGTQKPKVIEGKEVEK